MTPTWDDISSRFILSNSHPRYAVLDSKMLELIAKLRDDPALEDIIPGVSMAALTFMVEGNPRQIQVIYNYHIADSDTYDICFSHCGDTEETFFGEYSTVTAADIVEAVHTYLARLKGE